ncbi:hypothetical protein M2302_003395 [Micromonospora sp. A200]|nr:hypothetical protein [Micromonospora sp. A200]
MTAALAPAALDAADWQARRAAHVARDLRKRNSGTSQRWGVCKRHEADNKGPNR